MKLIYSELGGTHNVTGDWNVLSLSMTLKDDAGHTLHKEDVMNKFIWGGPQLLYHYFSNNHGTSEYYDWLTPINIAVENILRVAIDNINPDEELTIVTWDGVDWLPTALEGLPVQKVSHMINAYNFTLPEACSKVGYVMKSYDTDGRVEAIEYLYYNHIARLE